MNSTIRLFKALPIDSYNKAENKELMALTLSKGFIFDPFVIASYPDTANLIKLVNGIYGRDAKELNQSFHKSFSKVRDASILQLVVEQLTHYLTTYGAESLGIYTSDSVYIPAEELDIPELKDGVRIVVIRGLTKQELTDKLMELLSSGVALSETTIKDAIEVAEFVDFDETRIDEVKNREVKSALYDHFDIVPSEPVEFLRYVVYRRTGNTLLIKNTALIEQIKEGGGSEIASLFKIYEEEFGLQNLSKIFYRYKPIFLAFRSDSKLKKTINQIRRLAKVNHEPLKADLLNSITSMLKNEERIPDKEFDIALNNASIFRKARLAYALKFRTGDTESILYRVRNGKSYAKEFEFDNQDGANTAYDKVINSIVEDIKPNVEGKKVFIPEGIKYSLPATEKQFTGNIPTGSYVEVTDNMVCGIHWENVPGSRIDLDLSIQNAQGKIGWDGAYRDDKNGIYFSGDITDAPKPKGASELFHIGSQARGAWIMFVNYYNFDQNVAVPFKIVVAREGRDGIDKNHTVNPNNIVALSNTVTETKMKNLGIIVADEKSTKFYFAESNIGNAITAHDKEYTEHARKFLLNYYTDSIVLNDVLTNAGAELVDSADEADINLSPENIDKSTILNILKKEV